MGDVRVLNFGKENEMKKLTEYEELKAEGLTDKEITLLRSFGCTHAAILLWAKQHPKVG